MAMEFSTFIKKKGNHPKYLSRFRHPKSLKHLEILRRMIGTPKPTLLDRLYNNYELGVILWEKGVRNVTLKTDIF